MPCCMNLRSSYLTTHHGIGSEPDRGDPFLDSLHWCGPYSSFLHHIMQSGTALRSGDLAEQGRIVADEGIAQLKKRGASLEAVFQQLTSSAG